MKTYFCYGVAQGMVAIDMARESGPQLRFPLVVPQVAGRAMAYDLREFSGIGEEHARDLVSRMNSRLCDGV